jgi:hypothetical protein
LKILPSRLRVSANFKRVVQSPAPEKFSRQLFDVVFEQTALVLSQRSLFTEEMLTGTDIVRDLLADMVHDTPPFQHDVEVVNEGGA